MSKKPESTIVTTLEGRLSQFLTQNPYSSVEEKDGDFAITLPWGDPTLEIALPSEENEKTELIDVINRLVLPQEFSAVLHVESGKLEVLWTALQLGKIGSSVKEREFSFEWKGVERFCKFGGSSEELKRVSKYCSPIRAENDTSHRNIVSFRMWANEADVPFIDEPRSFFVDCDGLSSDEMVNFIRHLNAYMLYFDRQTPRVLVHAVQKSDFTSAPRFADSSFPKSIAARSIDDNLLSLWTESAHEEDNFMRFLLLYRVVEFSSNRYLDGEAQQQVKRLLNDPALRGNVQRASRRLTEVLLSTKELEQIPRMQNMIEARVELQKIWDIIELNRKTYSENFRFEGGFEVKHLLSNGCNFDNWKPNAVRSTFDRLRNIRNALSHGSDKGSKGTIQPTSKNKRDIVPWLNILETIAAEVMFLDDND